MIKVDLKYKKLIILHYIMVFDNISKNTSILLALFNLNQPHVQKCPALPYLATLELNIFQVALEVINVTVRTIIYTTLVMSWNGQNAVLAFSFAQLASVFTYTVSFYVYFWYYIRNKNNNLPFNSMWDFFPKIFNKVKYQQNHNTDS